MSLQSPDSLPTPESDQSGKVIVLMGVSGAGKSTIGQILATAINCSFIDADDYHSNANKEKMKNGIPLTDIDRLPWLETLRDTLHMSLVKGQTVILGCSALKRRYRDILRSADPNRRSDSPAYAVKLVYLDVGADVLTARLEKRAAGGNHFMPAKLLQSQLDSLQIDDSEDILKVDATLAPQSIVSDIQVSLL